MKTVLASILLCLFLFLAAFFTVYYDYGAHGVYRQQEWDAEQKAQVVATLNYLGYQDADLSFYDDSERSHLADVKGLLTVARVLTTFLLIVLVILFLFTPKDPKKSDTKKSRTAIGHRVGKGNKGTRIHKSLLYGGAGILGLVVVLSLLSLLDFTQFWTAFHHVLFPQGNWAFPATSTLITLFPESFFRGFALQTLLAAWSYGIVAVLAGVFTRPSG